MCACFTFSLGFSFEIAMTTQSWTNPQVRVLRSVPKVASDPETFSSLARRRPHDAERP